MPLPCNSPYTTLLYNACFYWKRIHTQKLLIKWRLCCRKYCWHEVHCTCNFLFIVKCFIVSPSMENKSFNNIRSTMHILLLRNDPLNGIDHFKQLLNRLLRLRLLAAESLWELLSTRPGLGYLITGLKFFAPFVI